MFCGIIDELKSIFQLNNVPLSKVKLSVTTIVQSPFKGQPTKFVKF